MSATLARIDQMLKDNGVSPAQYLRDWGHKCSPEERNYLEKLSAPAAPAVADDGWDELMGGDPAVSEPVVEQKMIGVEPITAPVDGEFPTPADGAIWMLLTHGIPQTVLCGVDWIHVDEKRRGKAPFLSAWQRAENTLKTVEAIRAASVKYSGCNFGSVFNKDTFAFEADTPPADVPAVVVRFSNAGGAFTSPLKIASSEGRGHRYYRWVEGLENIAQSLDATKYGDFSIRVDGEQCVSPGSVHPRTRKQYRVISTGVIGAPSQQEMDFWKSEQVEKKSTPIINEKGERRLIQHGNMHGAYVAEAGRLWNRGYEAEDVVEMTARWMVANGEPPVDENKVRKEALSVTKYKRGEAPESAALVMTSAQKQNAVSGRTLNFVRGNSVKPVRLKWLWSGRILANKLNVFSGEPDC